MLKLNSDSFGSVDLSYEKARDLSQSLDLELGFEVEKVEAFLLEEARSKRPDGDHRSWGQSLHQGNQTWVGLSHQTLQTPYPEIKCMLRHLNPLPGQLVVDLGAGYGRMGLVLHVLYPDVFFEGHEYVRERVKEGQRILNFFGCSKAKLLEKDLTACNYLLPKADLYFLYDYGTLDHIRKTLSQLEKMADTQKFKLIARGKGTRSLIQYEYPWLSQVFPAIHEEHFSIYSMSN